MYTNLQPQQHWLALYQQQNGLNHLTFHVDTHDVFYAPANNKIKPFKQSRSKEHCNLTRVSLPLATANTPPRHTPSSVMMR